MTVSKKTYRISTRTGTRKGAGTDAGIFIRLYDEKNRHTGWIELDTKGDNFEKGDLDRFTISDTNSLGTVTRVAMKSNNRGKYAAWYLEYVTVQEGSGDTQTIYFGTWFDSAHGFIHTRELLKKEYSYAVTIRTGNEKNSGTDAIVGVTLRGTRGNSQNMLVDKSEYFERGTTDSFIVKTPYKIGDLTSVSLSQNNDHDYSGWFVQYVSVTDLTSGKNYHAHCNEWLLDSPSGFTQRNFRLSSGVIRPEGSRIKAIVKLPERSGVTAGIFSRYYIFSDHDYIRYSFPKGRADAHYPRSIKENWKGAPTTGIDAAVAGKGKRSDRVYFFHGDSYTRYNDSTGKVDQAARKIKGNWLGIFERDIDAVVSLEGTSRMIFFKGDECVEYDFYKGAVGSPVKISTRFPGVWSSGIDAVVTGEMSRRNKIYFFKGGEYIRYDYKKNTIDADYPRPISLNWKGVWFPTGAAPETKSAELQLVDVKCYDTEDVTGDDELYFIGAFTSAADGDGLMSKVIHINDGETRSVKGTNRVNLNHKGESNFINLSLTAYDGDVASEWKDSDLRKVLDTIDKGITAARTVGVPMTPEVQMAALGYQVGYEIADFFCSNDKDDKLGKINMTIPLHNLPRGDHEFYWNFYRRSDSNPVGLVIPGGYSTWSYRLKMKLTVK